jgi:hypothetical protein
MLAADKLMQSPRLYATSVAFLRSFRAAARGGRPLLPKLVFLFDEAHCCSPTPARALISKVEQVARLIRLARGVFHHSEPSATCPDVILGQLGKSSAAREVISPPRTRRTCQGCRDLPVNPVSTRLTRKDPRCGTGEAVTRSCRPRGVPVVSAHRSARRNVR